jgi:hypothetical protein
MLPSKILKINNRQFGKKTKKNSNILHVFFIVVIHWCTYFILKNTLFTITKEKIVNFFLEVGIIKLVSHV